MGVNKAHSVAKNKKMSSSNKRLPILVFGLLFACLGVLLLIQSFAAVVAVTATTNKTSVEKGQTFIVTLGTDSGTEPISIGHVRLTYDPTKIEYVSTDYANTSFTDNTPDKEEGAGFVQISRFTTSPTAGNVVIGRVTFKALASSGKLDIGIDRDNSNVFSAVSAADILGAVSGVSIDVKQPTSGGSGGGTTTPAIPPKVPKGDAVKVAPKPTTSSGSRIARTDYYVNRQLVGSSDSPTDPVNLDTNNLAEGTYEITAESFAEDGTTETTTSQLTVAPPTFFERFKLPIIASGVATAAVIAFFVLKFVFARSVPFYRTIGQH